MKRLLLTLALAWTLGGVMSLPAFSQGADADARGRDWDHDYQHRQLSFISALPVPGTSATTPFAAFDIIYVKPRQQKMVLSSRSSKAVVIYDVFTDIPVGSTAAVFAGQGSSNSVSGPDGTLIAGHRIWAGDYCSAPGENCSQTGGVVRVFDLRVSVSSPPEIAAIYTGGTTRADEMDYDPGNKVVLVTTGDASPPYVSLISTETLSITKQVTFDGTNGTPDATQGGLGSVLYDSMRRKFLISIPWVGSDQTNGAVAEMDPRTGDITHVFYGTEACMAAGMAQGPGENVLVGCDPGFPPPDPTVYSPRTYVINGRTGKVVATINQVGGEDEVWYNPGDHRYYTGSRDFFTSPTATAATPVLGVIDADTNRWIENVPTGPNSHSVAANPLNNHIYVPLKNPNALCGSLPGCVGVFGYTDHHD